MPNKWMISKQVKQINTIDDSLFLEPKWLEPNAYKYIHIYIRRGQHGLRACRGRAAKPQNPFFPSVRGGFPSPYPSRGPGPAGLSFLGKSHPPWKCLKTIAFVNVSAYGAPKDPSRTLQGPQGLLRDLPGPPRAPQGRPKQLPMSQKDPQRPPKNLQMLKTQQKPNGFSMFS